MSKVDKAKLRELAEKATPGPWWIDSHGHRMCTNGGIDTVFIADDRMGEAVRHPETGNLSHWPNDWDATFIAAANPATILALLDEIEALRKDAERYRWLRLGGNDDSELDRWEDVGYVCGVSVCTDYGFQQTLDSESLDEAIDAAMQREKDRGR